RLSCSRSADDGGRRAVRVGVLGATGRMGLTVCNAVLDAPDLGRAAAVARATGVGRPLRDLVPGAPEELLVTDRVTGLLEAGAEVVVDFSRPEATAAAVGGGLGEGGPPLPGPHR